MSEKDFLQIIAEEMNLKIFQVANTVELLDTGNTVPFIARYRKEATGKLDEGVIREIEERIRYLRALDERKQTVLKSIEAQGKLTEELAGKISSASKIQEVEDLYLPYRPKKRTRATIAREKGLEPLATEILDQQHITGDPLQFAEKYINPQKDIHSAEQALQGALDIIAEMMSEDADLRKQIRNFTRKYGSVTSRAKSSANKSEFDLYADFRESVTRIVPHRILAMNRGEREKILKIQIEIDEQKNLEIIQKKFIKNFQSIFTDRLRETISDAYHRLIKPSMERDIRNELTEKAEDHAIQVFGANLKNLLLQPPIKNNIIMGIDPGFRTGCKLAVIDETGRYLEGNTIYPHPPQNEIFEAKTILRRLIDKYTVRIIGIGNGTASRETEMLIAELIEEIKKDYGRNLQYIIVNEAGASVYSASPLAKKEFPDLDASMRGNISIARRLLDPLAELVKIEPKSIGVGLYQHDVNQKKLEEKLHNVVESAVNMVGIDLNTASSSLLKYISGLNSRTSDNIVKYREDHGKFKERKEINSVPGIGANVFEQCAGFLRIVDGVNPLDNTSIHPESYRATERLLKKFHLYENPVEWKNLKANLMKNQVNYKEMASELDIGEPTLEDILTNLEKPGRDPREEMPKPILRSDVLKFEDLREGMLLKGVVRNVVDFGAFIDIGLKRDGLVHVSQMGHKFVKNPHKIVSVGDVISVKVIKIDRERERVSLSMKIS